MRSVVATQRLLIMTMRRGGFAAFCAGDAMLESAIFEMIPGCCKLLLHISWEALSENVSWLWRGPGEPVNLC